MCSVLCGGRCFCVLRLGQGEGDRVRGGGVDASPGGDGVAR